MLLHRRSVLSGGLAFAAGMGRSWALASPEEDIAALLKASVDVGHQSTGLVAAVLDEGRRIDAAYGRSDSADNRALDADTVFEIGSITKVFTALLLADMIVRGELAASDPVAKFLPDNARVPYFEETPSR